MDEDRLGDLAYAIGVSLGYAIWAAVLIWPFVVTNAIWFAWMEPEGILYDSLRRFLLLVAVMSLHFLPIFLITNAADTADMDNA